MKGIVILLVGMVLFCSSVAADIMLTPHPSLSGQQASIDIEVGSAETRVEISFQDDLYRFIGPEESSTFIPFAPGRYIVRSYADDASLVDEKSFSYANNVFTLGTIIVGNAFYQAQEPVTIALPSTAAQVIIRQGDLQARYLDVHDTFTFTPPLEGDYIIDILDSNRALLNSTTIAVEPALQQEGQEQTTTQAHLQTHRVTKHIPDTKQVRLQKQGKPVAFSLVPTEEAYDITIAAGDLEPGLYTLTYIDDQGQEQTETFTWGLVSVNTQKPMYHPGETAVISIVVLDTTGYPVSDASITLRITIPSGAQLTKTTADDIRLVQSGVYQIDLLSSEEGNYSLEVTANASGVNASFAAYYMTSAAYPFDIVRRAPFMIDPWRSGFTVMFDITPYVNASDVVLRERLPAVISIVSTNGEASITAEGTTITWHLSPGVQPRVQPYYIAQVPLRAPFLYQLGQADVQYDGGTFVEARPWWLAVDPRPYFKMEILKVVNVSTNWTRINFRNNYTYPVVTASAEPASTWTIDDPPFGVNIKAVESTGVNVSITIPERQFGAGTMPNNNTVYLFVVEQGFWNSSSSRLNFTMEARRVNSSAVPAYWNYNTTMLGSNTISVSLTTGWGTISKVYLLTAAIDANSTWIATAMFGSTTAGTPPSQTATSGILLAMSATNVTPQLTHPQEELHFMAVQNGIFNFSSITFRAFRTSDSIDEYTANRVPVHSMGVTPLWGVLSQVAQDQLEGGWANWRKIPFNTTFVKPYIQEDRYADTETALTSENVDIFLTNATNWSYYDTAILTAAGNFTTTPIINQSGSILFAANCTVGSIVPAGGIIITLQDNSSGGWLTTPTTDTDVYANTSSYVIGDLDNATASGTYTFNITGIINETYGFMAQCNATNAQTANSTPVTLNVSDIPPLITVRAVDTDVSSPYATADQTPNINASINENATCYLSNVSETYVQMVANGRVYCGNYTQSTSKNCTYTTSLPAGYSPLYMACNDTGGTSMTTPTFINLIILCDTHGDCIASQYCNILQVCTDDVPAGYPCSGVAYGGGYDDEVCTTGAGVTAVCVNDSTYGFTGWYCTADSDDCVYNDGGNSYDLNYYLCNASINDYRACAAGNAWGDLVDCGDVNDAANQTANASTHPGEYCGYFSANQTCTSGDSDLGTFGCSGSTADCGSYVYLGGGACGSVLAACDAGCGATCDVDSSTASYIASGTCYYDWSCNNSCGFMDSQELAPDFCIDDDDGGACAYTLRTDPTAMETCYWAPDCQNTTGATLTESGVLRADYCDYCTASGNVSGQYSPEPNASCTSGCANEGTLYYDTGDTPLDRSDDCFSGTTTIATDTLTYGDVWNGSGTATCNETECNTDWGPYLNGTCTGGPTGACTSFDNETPSIVIYGPSDDNWLGALPIVFSFSVNDLGSNITNCTLYVNGVYNASSVEPQESTTINFTANATNGTLLWNISCWDNSNERNRQGTATFTVGVDTTFPALYNPAINDTSFKVNKKICLNISANDTISGLASVIAELNVTGLFLENVTLYDDATTACDASNGNGVYSVEYLLQYNGNYTWMRAFAVDQAGNTNTTAPGLTWNVSAGGVINVSMVAPTTIMVINESGSHNSYTQTCNTTCMDNGTDCTLVVLYPSYDPGAGYVELNTTTTTLVSSEDPFSCGTVDVNTSCQHSFTVTAGEESGNNTWPVRCEAYGDNSALVSSDEVDVSINDRPAALLFAPTNMTWLSGVTLLNGTTSWDADGSISSWNFSYDNTTAFASPTTACTTTNGTCSWNTSLQDQCVNESMSCYVLLVVTDDAGLQANVTALVGIDNNGPTSTLDQPLQDLATAASPLVVNGSANDAGVGSIGAMLFSYRQNASASWVSICNDTTSPYTCSWDVSALPDGDAYEVRVYANDSLGSLGPEDTHTNITLDRTPPAVYLEYPNNSTFTTNTTIVFVYNVSYQFTTVVNCSLVINDSINQTNNSIIDGQPLNFTLEDITNGSLSWQINCTDALGNQNTSELRTLTIDQVGPTSTLDRPLSSENIMGSSTTVNGSAVDDGVGNISALIFDYRENSSAAWQYACTADAAPYACTWSLSGLPDGDAYEVRVLANDTLGNNGSYDTHTSIRLDNNGPNVTLVSPVNDSTVGSGDVFFTYTVADVASGVSSCSLIIDGVVNQTNSFITEGGASFFVTGFSNGNYLWQVNCTDDFPTAHTSASSVYDLTIDKKNQSITRLLANASLHVGNELVEILNVLTNTTDAYNVSLNMTVVTDIINGNATHAWWNASWKERKLLALTNGQVSAKTNVTVIVNVSNVTDCTQLRIVSIDRDETPSEVYASGSDWCSMRFLANISASATERNYYAYYNNSGAGATSYALGSVQYALFFDGFEAGSNFLFIAGACSITGNHNCSASSPWDGFTNCVESEAVTAYGVCSSTDMAASGSRGLEARGGLDRNVNNADGLYLIINSTPCGGSACQQVNISYYQAGFSLDSSSEGGAVYVNDSDGVLTLISDCMGGEACNATLRTTMGASAEFVRQDVCQLSGINCSQALQFRFTSKNVAAHSNNDYMAWDAVNITAVRFYDSFVTGTSGSTETYINSSSLQSSGSSGLLFWDWTPSSNVTGTFTAVSLSTRTGFNFSEGYAFFDLINDSTVPNVRLNGPASGSESNSSVTFSYLVNDTLSTIANCSLIIDGAVVNTTYPPIIENQVSSFYPRIPGGGPHNWSVNCSDYYGNRGASQTWNITIIPPDLIITPGNIMFSNTTPIEGQNVTIFANIFNIGGSDAYTISIEIWLLGNNSRLYNVTLHNLTDAYGTHPNATINTSWIVPGPGPFRFAVLADIPIETNGSIFEIFETNNNATAVLNISGWQYFYGSINATVGIGGFTMQFMGWNASAMAANMYVIETNANVSWTQLQALSLDVFDGYQADDFPEADVALNMTLYVDSVNASYTGDGNPLMLRNFTVFGQNITNVSIVNSTNSSNFVTGILWDTSDGDLEYNGSQDLVFVTSINGTKSGLYGNYDFELRIPVNLKNYKELAADTVTLYFELS